MIFTRLPGHTTDFLFFRHAIRVESLFMESIRNDLTSKISIVFLSVTRNSMIFVFSCGLVFAGFVHERSDAKLNRREKGDERPCTVDS